MSFDLSKESFELRDELKIRNVLEDHTDWRYEFTKNSKYEYDLQLFQWSDPPRNPDDRKLMGYVEIERTSRSSDWQSGDLPSHWPELRFCRRKIDTGRPPSWKAPKDNYAQTIYLKFNHSIDNCFAAPLPWIRTYGESVYWPDNKRTRESAFYALPRDSDHIKHGINNCIKLIKEYLTTQRKHQMQVNEF
jgi:hypothetical protein